MTTPLFWKAWHLSNLVYDTILRYQLPVKMIPKLEKFVLIKLSKKLKLFIFVLLQAFTLYINLILQAVVIESINLKTYVLIIDTAMAGSVALCLVLSAIILPCAHTLFVQFLNSLIQSNNRLLKLSGHHIVPCVQDWSLFRLLKQELNALRFGRKPDICGLFITALTGIIILNGVFVAPFEIFAGVDPFSQTFKIYCDTYIQSLYFKYACYFISYVFTQWCTLEATRIYILILIPTLSMCNLYLGHLEVIGQRKLNKMTLILYEELNCVNQIGENIIARIAGSLMGIGFIILIFVNWVILKGWGKVPFEMYIVLLSIAIIIYAVISQTVPLAIKCDSKSKAIIRSWSFQASMFSPSTEKKYLKRRVRAQQPVAINYAQTKFEKDTQIHYYSSIVDYTIDALILLE